MSLFRPRRSTPLSGASLVRTGELEPEDGGPDTLLVTRPPSSASSVVTSVHPTNVNNDNVDFDGIYKYQLNDTLVRKSKETRTFTLTTRYIIDGQDKTFFDESTKDLTVRPKWKVVVTHSLDQRGTGGVVYPTSDEKPRGGRLDSHHWSTTLKSNITQLPVTVACGKVHE